MEWTSLLYQSRVLHYNNIHLKTPDPCRSIGKCHIIVRHASETLPLSKYEWVVTGKGAKYLLLPPHVDGVALTVIFSSIIQHLIDATFL